MPRAHPRHRDTLTRRRTWFLYRLHSEAPDAAASLVESVHLPGLTRVPNEFPKE